MQTPVTINIRHETPEQQKISVRTFLESYFANGGYEPGEHRSTAAKDATTAAMKTFFNTVLGRSTIFQLALATLNSTCPKPKK